MFLHAKHTVGFLHLAAIELRKIAVEITMDDVATAQRLHTAADKCDEEAVVLNTALATGVFPAPTHKIEAEAQDAVRKTFGHDITLMEINCILRAAREAALASKEKKDAED